MGSIKGKIRVIIYESDSNYKVGEIKVKETNDTEMEGFVGRNVHFTGYFANLQIGDNYEMEGTLVYKDKYGYQYNVTDYKRVEAKGRDAVIEFLTSDLVKGCGEATATLIVDTLGEDCLKKIKENPEILLTVPKMTQKKAEKIYSSLMKIANTDEMLINLKELGFSIQEALNIIVKADVQGTAEAVKASLEKIDVDGVRVNVIRSTVGAISESDVILASASQAIIYGFNVRPDAKVRNKAEEENVEIRLHNVIYKMVEEIETAMKGMLAPEYHEVITGQAEIRQVIKASKIGNIAGCYVTDGSIKRNCGIRLIRDGIVVYEGKLASLRRFKDDVKEVNAGFECGLNIENYNDIKEGDIIEGYVMEEVEKK